MHIKKANKVQKSFVLQIAFVSLKFGGTALVSSMMSSHIITESLIIRAKYLPFSQLHVAGFKI